MQSFVKHVCLSLLYMHEFNYYVYHVYYTGVYVAVY